MQKLTMGRFCWGGAIVGMAVLVTGCPSGGTNNNNNNSSGTVEVTTNGEGTVDQAAVGDLVRLTATADDGWLFDGWSGAAVDDQGANPLTVNPNVIESITANFIEDDNTPPSPGDADGDGVRDTSDACPGTPPGTPVDSTGCEATGPDADGDDVPDSADQCPDTTAGASVNAAGCSAGQRDTDGDGVNDAVDECDRTPPTVDADDRGCPISQPGTPDDDDDTVPDDIDQCDDTPASAAVDANGCAESQLDTDEDGVHDDQDDCPGTAPRTSVDAQGCPTGTPPPPPPPPPPAGCGDGTVNGTEQCDAAGESATCNANCTTSSCGDGNRNATAGEQCDDGNTTSGDGCSATCRTEGANIPNDACATPVEVTDGTREFNNVGATTDGPDEPVACDFFNQTQVESDLWYCYTATCTGTATISLCGSDFDTRLAVYPGCGCPTAAATACSDDSCGTGVENVQSRLEISVAAGSKYMLRVGAFETAQGVGRLTIGCNLDVCANGTGDCLAASPTLTPGCGDATCCTSTCELDRFCCDVIWDATCAGEAQGICSGHFPACAVGSGSCAVEDATPGCDNESCCDTVCRTDPFCCLTTWDATCVNEAQSQCLLSCGRDAGECGTTHATPGCNDQTCCALVCDAVDGDPFCCNTEWDQVCVDLAVQNCP